MSLPNPSMDAVPFTPITSEFGDNLIENIEALAAGTGLDDGAVTDDKWVNGVAFSAHVTTNYASTTGLSVIQYGTEVYDLGSNYNNTTYTFTAPYNCIMNFSAAVHVQGVGNQSVIISMFKNGVAEKRGNQIQDEGASKSQLHLVSADIQLASGDTVDVRNQTVTASRTISAGVDLSYFTGHLVTRT